MQPFWNNQACKRNHSIHSSFTGSLNSQLLLSAAPFGACRGERLKKPPLPIGATNF
ncbi:hypothetical protein FDUTEX481_01230 [Tolypothrix sp. PCC 7601]|nr:hypothetical protein FDUTEX481_01230 [Tolypothrix sp. PCC 7601]